MLGLLQFPFPPFQSLFWAVAILGKTATPNAIRRRALIDADSFGREDGIVVMAADSSGPVTEVSLATLLALYLQATFIG